MIITKEMLLRRAKRNLEYYESKEVLESGQLDCLLLATAVISYFEDKDTKDF